MPHGFRLILVAALVALVAGCHDAVAPEPDLRIVAPFDELNVDGNMKLTASLAGTDGASVPNDQVEWTSSDTRVIEISADGGVVGKKVGRSTITARVGPLSATLTLTVIPSYAFYLLYVTANQVGPTGLNNAGHAVAWVDTTGIDGKVNRVSYIWTQTQRISLGAGEALDINDQDEVVGTSDGNALFWSGSERTTLFSRAGGTARATVINNSTSIAGDWTPSDGSCVHCERDIFFGAPGNVKVILTNLTDGRVRGLSNDGSFVGVFGTASGDSLPFLFKEGQLIHLPFDGEWAVANDVNDLRFVIGSGPDGLRAWRDTDREDIQPTEPGACATTAEGINNLGQIVGSHDCVATLWRDGRPIDLQIRHGFFAWTLTRAIRINDRGQILAFGVNSESNLNAVVLLDPL